MQWNTARPDCRRARATTSEASIEMVAPDTKEKAPRTPLRRRLNENRILIAPGAYDGLTAKLVQLAGFEAVYMTGAGLSYSLLGQRDIGLLTMSEMVSRAGYIAQAVDLPLIADADTGYGDENNVARTVAEFERAGAAAIQLEDQDFPKRCGHLGGKTLVPTTEMEARIRAAVAARNSDDFLIIGRTDARAVEGMPEALERAARYKEAGADVLFVEAPQSEEELALIGRELSGPLMANMVEGGKTPLVDARRLEEWGYRLVIFPNSITRLLARVGLDMFGDLRRRGTTDGWRDRMMSFSELNVLLEGSARDGNGADG